ncbi:MAG: adenylate/guanylate cyclase domain-containing protein [Terracidiphilus sp.]|jgi:class 3 adenylate cyclase/tetratricopeptide (TPR) repeat protein
MPDSEQIRERFQAAKAFFNNGEFFRSYDLAVEAIALWPEEMRFAHLAVLSLANAGASDLALEKYAAFGLDRSTELDARTLLARLKKDQGFATSGTLRLKLLREARAIYENAYAISVANGDPGAYYPGINSAALALWTGDSDSARRIARKVLDGLEATAGEFDAENHYWLRVTALEAHLILDQPEQARSIAEEVLAAGAAHCAQVATTCRQLRRVAEAKGISPEFLRGFTPQTIIHFTGHIIAAPKRQGRFEVRREKEVYRKIEELFQAENVGSGYGSLAAGADILFAEALLARGAALHVILPFPIPEFLEQSVRSAGESWIGRFHDCLAAATTVRYATEDNLLEDEVLFRYTSQLGMGLAVLAARHLQAPLMQFAVWDGEAKGGASGTVSDMKAWSEAKFPQRVILCGDRTEADDLSNFNPPESTEDGHRTIRAMMFGDVHGFSKLNDRELPRFATQIIGQMGTVVRTYRDDTAFVNTWGDGIFAVFADVGKAAAWALQMQQAMRSVDLASVGLPAHLELRLGGHLGPAYELPDPVLERLNYYGVHVNRASRIEPVAPPGCVYVTETFAAVLALKCPTEFACDYVGYTEMAKAYGRLRIFLLRAATGGVGPAVLGDIERTPLESQSAPNAEQCVCPT